MWNNRRTAVHPVPSRLFPFVASISFKPYPFPFFFAVPFVLPKTVAAHFTDPFRSDPLLATVNQKPSNAALHRESLG